MANWLLDHQAQRASYLLLGSFACAAGWETFLPRRPLALPLRPLRAPEYAVVRSGRSVASP